MLGAGKGRCITIHTRAWQNRAGEELAAELAKRMEQCLKATPSGRGRAAALLPLHGEGTS